MRIFHSDPQRYWYFWAVALGIVLLRGLFIPVMDVDASQYASISMEMLQNGNWLEVQHRHHDYLDKPPLLFWLSAISFWLFGQETWAYKLPSVLGALLGVWAVFGFCFRWYSREIARRAAFMLASSVGFLLLCNDVRTDTLLMGTTAAAVWQLSAFGQNNRKIHVIAAGFFIGLAMLAKGPLGLILPAVAVGAHLLMRGQWRGIFRWEWLLALPVIAVLLLPMSYGLYHQFDLHPEKVINGRTGVSGLYFFFWEQSFGRITGENVWQNDTSGFYFLHVMAWAFLPWTLWLAGSLVRRFRNLWSPGQEYYSLGAFILVFIALSQSRYKLPHYIFVLLPWASVLAAAYWERLQSVKALAVINFGLTALTIAVAALLPAYVFATTSLGIWGPFVVLAGFGLYFTWPNRVQGRRFWGNLSTGILVGFTLNFHFYPALMPYQSSSTAGQWLREQGIRPGQVACMGRSGHALDFYAGHIVPYFDSAEKALEYRKAQEKLWIYVREGGKEQLDAAGVAYSPVLRLKHYQPALLKLDFLNPATRDSTLWEVEVVELR